MAEPVRTAILVASSGSPGIDDQGGDFFNDVEWREATVLSAAIESRLSALGYDVTRIVDGSPAEIQGAVTAALRRDLTVSHSVLLHVVGHGTLTRSGQIMMPAKNNEFLNLTQLVRDAADGNAAEATEFLALLDLCFAGTVLHESWSQGLLGHESQTWVLAACSLKHPIAFDGNFTRAVIRTLDAIMSREIQLDPTLKSVPLSRFAVEVRRRVADINHSGFIQDVAGTYISITQPGPDCRFFPLMERKGGSLGRMFANPRLAISRRFVEAACPDIDVDHFLERASGGDLLTSALFRGRRSELAAIAEFLDEGFRGTLVVTGSPGCGKSALMGIVASAAHPDLRHATTSLWDHLPRVPRAVERMVLVHARQMTFQAVLGAVKEQASPGRSTDTEDPTRLIREIAALTGPTTVLIDAVDECLEVGRLVAEFLEPLANYAARTPGSLNLVVGTRSGPDWPEVNALLSGPGTRIIDLDLADTDQLRADVAEYVSGAMRSAPATSSNESREARDLLATAIAERAVSDTSVGTGAFLLAGLVVNRALESNVGTVNESLEFISRIPRSLPEIVDLDLPGDTVMSIDRAARSALAALAAAAGDGLPEGLLQAMVLGGSGEVHLSEPIDRVLARIRFYVRSSIDSDGRTLYRLFHQSLVDALAEPSTPALICSLIRQEVTIQGASRWDLASAYALRHYLQHAVAAGEQDSALQDVELMVYAVPSAYLHFSINALNSRAKLCARVYRGAYRAHHELQPEERRLRLAAECSMNHASDLAEELLAGSRSPVESMDWYGPKLDNSGRIRLVGHDHYVSCAISYWHNGLPFVATGGYDGMLLRWEAGSGRSFGEPMQIAHSWIRRLIPTIPRSCNALVIADGEPLMVWDLVAGRRVANLPESSGVYAAVVAGDTVIGAAQWGVATWRSVGDGWRRSALRGADEPRIVALAATSTALFFADDASSVWYRYGEEDSWIGDLGEGVTSLAAKEIDGETTVIAGGAFGSVLVGVGRVGDPLGFAVRRMHFGNHRIHDVDLDDGAAAWLAFDTGHVGRLDGASLARESEFSTHYAHRGGAFFVAVDSENSDRVISGGRDCVATVWDRGAFMSFSRVTQGLKSGVVVPLDDGDDTRIFAQNELGEVLGVASGGEYELLLEAGEDRASSIAGIDAAHGYQAMLIIGRESGRVEVRAAVSLELMADEQICPGAVGLLRPFHAVSGPLLVAAPGAGDYLRTERDYGGHILVALADLNTPVGHTNLPAAEVEPGRRDPEGRVSSLLRRTSAHWSEISLESGESRPIADIYVGPSEVVGGPFDWYRAYLSRSGLNVDSLAWDRNPATWRDRGRGWVTSDTRLPRTWREFLFPKARTVKRVLSGYGARLVLGAADGEIAIIDETMSTVEKIRFSLGYDVIYVSTARNHILLVTEFGALHVRLKS